MNTNLFDEKIRVEVKQLSPPEFTEMMRKLLLKVNGYLYSPTSEVSKSIILSKRTKKLLDSATKQQLRDFYKKENVQERLLDLQYKQAEQLHEYQKQTMFIGRVNPIIVKLITSYDSVISNFNEFELLVNKENSYIKSIKENESLFLALLKDIVSLEISLKVIDNGFMALAKEYLVDNSYLDNNTLFEVFESNINSYNNLKENNPIYKSFLQPLLDESILYSTNSN